MAQEMINEYKAYDISQRPGESNIDYYMRLAKQADTRMGRLEKLTGQKGYESVTSYAYAKAKRELSAFGWKHFERKPPSDPKLFRERLAAVKEFTSSPSSTKGGIQSIYQNKADTINEKYGTNFKWQDMGDFFESGIMSKLSGKDGYGSKTVLRSIGLIQQAKKSLSSMSTNMNFKAGDLQKEAALKILRSKKVSDALNLDKEDKQKIRSMIKNADDWLDASESDIEDYFN